MALAPLVALAKVASYPPAGESATPWFTPPRAEELRDPGNFYGSSFLNTSDSEIFQGYVLAELGEFEPFDVDGLPNIDIGVVFGWEKPAWDADVCDIALVAEVLPSGAAPAASMLVVQRAKDMALDVFPDFDMAMQTDASDTVLTAWLGDRATAAVLAEEHAGLSYRLYIGVSNKAACLNETSLEHGPYAAFTVSNRYRWVTVQPQTEASHIIYSTITHGKDSNYTFNNFTYRLPDLRGTAFFFNLTAADNAQLSMYLSEQNATTGVGKTIDVHVTLLSLNETGTAVLQREEYTFLPLGDMTNILANSTFAGSTQATVMIQVFNPEQSYDHGFYDMAITLVLDQPTGERKKKKDKGLASWVIPVAASAGGVVVLAAAVFVVMKMRSPAKDSYQAF